VALRVGGLPRSGQAAPKYTGAHAYGVARGQERRIMDIDW